MELSFFCPSARDEDETDRESPKTLKQSEEEFSFFYVGFTANPAVSLFPITPSLSLEFSVIPPNTLHNPIHLNRAPVLKTSVQEERTKCFCLECQYLGLLSMTLAVSSRTFRVGSFVGRL